MGWRGAGHLPPPGLGLSGSALQEAHTSAGWLAVSRLVKAALKSVRMRNQDARSRSAPPSSSPSPPLGAAGDYLLKHRPRSHLFAVNNPRHLSAFIKPFPSPRPRYFNNKSRVTFQRHY